MSKSKEKHHSHEDAEKNHPSSAGQASAPDDGRRTMDPPSPAFAEALRAGRPECFGGQATDLSRVVQDDGLPTDLSAIASATVEAPGAKAGRQPADQAEKLARLQDRLLRLQADFDNFRKRTLREKNELFDSANQALMLELLPVLDHLQLGIQAASAHQADPAFREGLTMIFDQLIGVLSKFGLSPIETENQVFDPNRFEAVNALPSATEPEGIVLALVRCGYMLRNKLLRPAQVIVSSGPPPEQNAKCKMQNAE